MSERVEQHVAYLAAWADVMPEEKRQYFIQDIQAVLRWLKEDLRREAAKETQ